MTPKKQQEKSGKGPGNDREVNQGTRSGRPNPEDVPSHPNEHRTSTDQRETQKGR